ncbi:hypothetical protein [Vibrio sp. WXL103]|uniref:hypothetical protein n=1 Tax=Vibrio sp. WXL103 TaxID=3450710 RepID=UPI003EC93E13
MKTIRLIMTVCCLLMVMSGCTYSKAMEEQQRRQDIINANINKESNERAVKEAEKIALEKQLSVLTTEVGALDKEIAQIELKQEQERSKNQQQVQKDYDKLLAQLKHKKEGLEKDIQSKKAQISNYAF